MDAVTAMAIDRGRKNNKLLVQPQYSPMPVGEQIAILYCGTKGLMSKIEVDQVPVFQEKFLQQLRARHQEDVIAPLAAGKIDETITQAIEELAKNVSIELA